MVLSRKYKVLLFVFVFSIFVYEKKGWASSFDGAYQSNCFIDSTDDDVLISKVEISNENFNRTWTAFEDKKCETPYLKYIEKYKYRLSGLDWDGTLLEVGYEPLTDEVAEALNSIQWCGNSGWSKGVYQIVTGFRCGDRQVAQVGQVLYSKMREEVSRPGLRFGKASPGYSGKTLERRHQEWSELWHFQL
ncbi:MAG TPA: hypothetical protein PLJ21_00785 [Pseudobdellovibrionaceae bacterium]|nr:hypothetical protein [Pseudobdellovibrionaceae bacterium]